MNATFTDPLFTDKDGDRPIRNSLAFGERLEVEEDSALSKLGGGLMKAFRKVNRASTAVKETSKGFLKNAFNHVRENKMQTALSVGIGLGASFVCPYAVVVAPVLAVGKEIHRKGLRNIDGKVDIKRLGRTALVASAASLVGFGAGELVGNLGIENWFTGNETLATPEVETPTVAEPVEILPVEQNIPTLLDQVDTSEVEALGYDYSWQEDVIANPELSEELRAQAFKDMSFAASFNNPELQLELLEVANDLDSTNLQVQNDLGRLRSLSQG